MTLWTTETAVWCFPDLIVVSLLLVNKSIDQVACLSVDNRACFPPESFRNTEGGCTIDGMADIRREDVQ